MQIGRKLVQRLVAAERRAVGVVLDRENLIPVLAVQADGQIPAAVQQIRPPVDHRHPTLGGQQDRIRVDALRRDGDLEAPQLQRPARRKIGQLRELLEAHRLRVMNGIRRRLGAAFGLDFIFDLLRGGRLCEPRVGKGPHGRVIHVQKIGCSCRRDVHGLRRSGFRLLLALRVSQEAHGHGDRRDHRRQHEPERGLFVVEDGFNARFDPRLAEGERAGRDELPRYAARQQRAGIGRLAPFTQLPHDLFVACGLNIAAEQDVRQPADRIEPVRGQDQIPQRLPQLVAAPQMCALVREHHRLRPGLQSERQINARPDHAEDERRGDELRLVHLPLQPHRRAHTQPQPQGGDGRVEQQRRDPCQPDARGDERPDLQRVRALRGAGRERRGQRGIDDRVDRRDAARDGGLRGDDDLRLHRLGARDETQHALNRHRAHQPHRRQRPQHAQQPPRRLFEHQPHEHDRQDQNARGQTAVQKPEKDVGHFCASSNPSIMARS